MKTYSPELKAQVIAEATLGAPVKQLARKYKVPEATVRYWRNTAQAQPVIAPEKKADLGALVYEYLAAGLQALIAQANAMADPQWFKEQGASAYLLHGTLADKLVIVFSGVERGAGANPDPGASIEGEAIPR